MFTYQLYPATHPIMPGHRCSSPIGSWVISFVEFKRDEHVGHLVSPDQVVFSSYHEPEGQTRAVIRWCSRANFGILYSWIGSQ